VSLNNNRDRSQMWLVSGVDTVDGSQVCCDRPIPGRRWG
jgi:hypothetical protein